MGGIKLPPYWGGVLPLHTLRDIPGRFPQSGHLMCGEFAQSGGSPIDQGVLGAATVGMCIFLITQPSPGFPVRPPINTALQEDAHLWEIPFRVTTQGSRCLKFINIFVLPYITIILLANSKSTYRKMSEKKKILPYVGWQAQSILLNMASNG